MKNFLKENAKNFALNLDDETLEKLCIFYDFLNEFNAHTNLIAKSDEKTILTKHFIDSMSFNKIPVSSEEFKLLDIGAGGGFPSVILAIIYPNAQITAIDSIGKKVNFLNQTAQKTGLENFKAINMRAEDLPDELKNSFDFVSARAVAALNILSEYCIPFVKKGGLFVAYKARTAREEIKDAKDAIKTLGGNVAEIIEYTLDDETERNLIIIEKTAKTALKYPRKSGLPKKNPL